jgi:hypothetical protein
MPHTGSLRCDAVFCLTGGAAFQDDALNFDYRIPVQALVGPA